MIRFQRSGRAKNGRWIEAIQFAKESAGYLNKKYSPLSCQVYATAGFGDIHAIYWYVDYEDLASIDKINAQIMSDQGYWAINNKLMECFIDGSFHDMLMRSV
jgi:hypothetical protein